MKASQSASLVLLIGLVSLVLTRMAGACSCLKSEYQTLYCTADIVIKGTIRSKEFVYGEAAVTNNEVFSSSQDSDSFSDVYIPRFAYQHPLFVIYNVSINAIFKGEKELSGMKKITLSSAGTDSFCGITSLKEGETYVISGFYWEGELNIGLCSSWVEPYKSLTNLQKRGLRRLYAKTCDDCKVCSQWESGCDSSFGCSVPHDFSDCSSRNTMCMRKASGKCAWKKNKYLKLC